MRDATFPVVLIVGGLAMLGWSYDWIPNWSTLVALAFIASGIAVFALDGMNRQSLVTGSILIAIGIGWYGYFALSWRSRLVIPILMIFSGLTMLVARHAPLPDGRSAKGGDGRVTMPPGHKEP